MSNCVVFLHSTYVSNKHQPITTTKYNIWYVTYQNKYFLLTYRYIHAHLIFIVKQIHFSHESTTRISGNSIIYTFPIEILIAHEHKILKNATPPPHNSFDSYIFIIFANNFILKPSSSSGHTTNPTTNSPKSRRETENCNFC